MLEANRSTQASTLTLETLRKAAEHLKAQRVPRPYCVASYTRGITVLCAQPGGRFPRVAGRRRAKRVLARYRVHSLACWSLVSA